MSALPTTPPPAGRDFLPAGAFLRGGKGWTAPPNPGTLAAELHDTEGPPMKYRTLGATQEKIPEICLGTMTWGTQNTEAEAHAQMACALEHGLTFWDTAELYPVNPTSAETWGTTERYIGSFLAANKGVREKLFLNSKVAGPGRPYIRNGEGFTPAGIRAALEGTLERLGTDYIDLYQLHWPNRGSYHFGQSWTYRPSPMPTAEIEADMLETLRTLDALVKEGKVRHIGLSNETAWGTTTFLKLARLHNLTRMVSIQNEFSLMYRHFALDLAEVVTREQVSLLAYSPMAAGWLSGKYYGGARPEGSRFALTGHGSPQRTTPQAQNAADAFTDIARNHGLKPSQMALAWVLHQPFVASAILGATSVEQLKEDIGAIDVKLSPEVLADIAHTLRDHPMPY